MRMHAANVFTTESHVAPAVLQGMGVVNSGELTTISGKMTLDVGWLGEDKPPSSPLALPIESNITFAVIQIHNGQVGA